MAHLIRSSETANTAERESYRRPPAMTAAVALAFLAVVGAVVVAARWSQHVLLQDLVAAGIPAGNLEVERSRLVPVVGFGVVMAVTMFVTAGTAAALLRAGAAIPALLTSIGVGVGPLSLLGFPGWTTAGGGDDVTVHTIAAAVGLLIGIALFAAAALLAHQAPRARPAWRLTGGYLVLLVQLAAGLFVTSAQSLLDPGHEAVSPVMAFGWVALAAGLVAAGWTGVASESTAVLCLVGAALPAAWFLALQNSGGWPTAPGWELSDTQSPLFLTVPLAVVVMACAGTGYAGAITRGLRRPAHTGAAAAVG